MSHTKCIRTALILVAVLISFPCLRADATITVIDEWRMGESDATAVPGGAATTSLDCIGTNNLQFHGATIYSSDVGNRTFSRLASTLCVNFTNNAYAIRSNVVSTLTDNFGIEAWVEPIASTDGLIAYNGRTDTTGWGLGIGSGNYTALFGGVDDLNGRFIILNSWSHVALVRSNGVAILYVNSLPTATNFSTPHIPAGNFGLATAPQVPGAQTFTGFMDEVRVFTFAPDQFSTNDLSYNAMPASTSTLPARNITATTATLNGFCLAGGLAMGGWFEWGLGAGYGNSTPPMSLGNSTSPVTATNQLNGLQPGTAYHFRFVTTNSAGTILRSWDQSFVTPNINIMGDTNQIAYVRSPFTNPPATLSATPLALSANDGANGMVLRADGTVALWGDNTAGQTNFANTLSNIIGIAAGNYHFLALKRDGTVVAWGTNTVGQTNVPIGLDNVVSVAAGGSQSMALRRDGSVVTWGAGVPLPQPLTNIIQLSASLGGAVALNAAGQVIFGGSVPTEATNIVSVASGAGNFMALRADGTLFVWGANFQGQTNIPVFASTPMAISAAGDGCMALLQSGNVVAWGSDDGNKNTIPSSVTNVIAIAAAGTANFAMRADGTAFGWGDPRGGETAVPSVSTLTNITGVINVSSSVNTNAPGLYALAYNTTNLFNAVNWATVSVQVGTPELTINSSVPNNVSITWPPAASGYTLEQSVTLKTNSWVPSPSGAANPTLIPTTNAALFYRLTHP